MKNLRWLGSYFYQVKGLFFISIFLMILETSSLTMLTWVQKFLIDDVFINGNNDNFIKLLVGIILAVLVFNSLLFITPTVSNLGVTALHRILITDLKKNIFKNSSNLIQKERVAKITQLFTNDVPNIVNLLERFARSSQQLFSFLLTIFIIMTADLFLVIILLVFGVIFVALGYFFGKPVKTASKNVEESREKLVVQIEEGISSTREVLAYHRMSWERERYNKVFANFFKKVMVHGKLSNKIMLLSDPIRWGSIIIVLGYGGYLVYLGNMSIGTFVIVYQFSSNLVVSLQSLFNSYIEISGKIACVERVKEFIEKNKNVNEEAHVRLGRPISELSFNNIYFKYSTNDNFALEHFSFNIPIGKKVAFIGESGSGKSTIAKLLANFDFPLNGHIGVNKLPLKSIEPSDWNERIGIVFQEPYFFPTTIRNNLLLGKTIPEERFLEICESLMINEFVSKLPQKYETIIGERGYTLSGGQRQRLALARVLISDPEILILDEATSALDVESERKIQNYLDKIRKGKTTIVIAHRLSTIQNSDLIFVMDKGQISEKGTHKELYNHGVLYNKLLTASVN